MSVLPAQYAVSKLVEERNLLQDVMSRREDHIDFLRSVAVKERAKQIDDQIRVDELVRALEALGWEESSDD